MSTPSNAERSVLRIPVDDYAYLQFDRRTSGGPGWLLYTRKEGQDEFALNRALSPSEVTLVEAAVRAAQPSVSPAALEEVINGWLERSAVPGKARTYFIKPSEQQYLISDLYRAATQRPAADAPRAAAPSAFHGFRCRKAGTQGAWTYVRDRAPDSWELRECEIQSLDESGEPVQPATAAA